MKMPSIKAVASCLRSIKRNLERGEDREVRLQVYEDGD